MCQQNSNSTYNQLVNWNKILFLFTNIDLKTDLGIFYQKKVEKTVISSPEENGKLTISLYVEYVERI